VHVGVSIRQKKHGLPDVDGLQWVTMGSFDKIWLRLKSAGSAQIPSWAGLQVKGIYVVNCMKPAIRNIGWRSSSYGSGASAAVGNLNQANITQVKWRGDKFCSKLWSANMTEMCGKRIKRRHQGWVKKTRRCWIWTETEQSRKNYKCIQLYSGDADGDHILTSVLITTLIKEKQWPIKHLEFESIHLIKHDKALSLQERLRDSTCGLMAPKNKHESNCGWTNHSSDHTKWTLVGGFNPSEKY